MLNKFLSVCAITLFFTSNIFAAEEITWIGPITVVSEKFAQHGGPFGFIHSLNQGDCCCGGPATEDNYPNQFKVDINNFIIVGDRELHKIHIFKPDGQLLTSFSRDKQCTSSFIWPGYILVNNNRIVVETGYCAETYDYSGKILWHLKPTDNSFPNLLSFSDNKIIFTNYSKNPWPSNDKELQDGWLVYDLSGNFINKIDNYKEPFKQDGRNVISNNITYNNVLNSSDRYGMLTDKNDLLYIFNISWRKPDNYELINEYNIGTIDIYNSNSVKVHSILFPSNKYSETNRTCGSEDYDAFAGKDIIEEYGKAFEIDRNGNVYTTLALPKELKIIKWSPINLNSKIDKNILKKLPFDKLRLLRNEIFARKGRQFKSKDLKEYFSKQPWYKERSDYNDKLLSEVDKQNVSLIMNLENN